MRFVVLVSFVFSCAAVVGGCSNGGGGGQSSSSPSPSPPSPQNSGNNQSTFSDPATMTDAQLIAATPAFRNQSVVVVTRRLNAPRGSTIVGAGAVAFAEPRPDPTDPYVMLVDVVADYGYDGNNAKLTEAWAKQNAPIINNYDAVRLNATGDNGYRGTLRVPVAVGMHFTLLKTSPTTIASAATVNPDWFFTGLPYDSTYDDPPQELCVWVAKDNGGTWHTYVRPQPGAQTPPPPASSLPQISSGGTGGAGGSSGGSGGSGGTTSTPLSITSVSANTASVAGGSSTTISVQTSGGSGTIRYGWIQNSGPAATIATPQSASTSVTMPSVASNQNVVFSVIVSDSSSTITSNPLTVQVTANLPPPIAPVHVATTIAGVNSTSATIAALTTAVVQVAFRDDNGDPLTCSLSRRGGELATISLLSSATAANVTTFTFTVVVNADPASAPSTFSFDALATDPGGLNAVAPAQQVKVFRCNRFAAQPGYRVAAVQVDAASGLSNEGPGIIALGTQTIASANEVDVEVFIDYPQSWCGVDLSVQSGWTPQLFRNPISGGVPVSYYDGVPLTLALDYGTGKIFKAMVRLRTDVGEHRLWAVRNGNGTAGDPNNVYMASQNRNHNYDDVDPNRGYKIVIDQAAQSVTLPPAPNLPP